MLRIQLDTSEVEGITGRAREAILTKTKAALMSALRYAAAEERQTHAYQNRTGLLERNTKAVLERHGITESRATLMMDREYATYVRDRGFSRIDSHAMDAEKQIASELDNIKID